MLCLILLGGVVVAQPPAGYYSAAEGLRGQTLESALRNIIDGHTSLSYDGAKTRLWDTVDPQGGVITCIYSGRTTTSLTRDTDSMNAEHTWPQSRGAGSTPPRSDLHHLFVTDAGWNSRRGSLRFATVTNPTATSPIGAKVNSSQGFEPPDEYKGDVARVIFYFAVRYDREVRNGAVLSGTDSGTSDDHMGELDDLVEWHFNDPPSAYEMTRNNRIYAIQGNRNPFIDRPEFLTEWLELGPSAPAIVASTSPSVPDYATPTHLRATITSAVAIDTATPMANWRIGTSGAFTPIPMSMVSGTTTAGTWQTNTAIPAQPGDTRVEYFVEVADVDGTTARDPATGAKFFIVRAPAPPVIALSTVPAAPRFDEPTVFRASITSDLGVQSGGAILQYRVGTAGDFTTLDLDLMTGTTVNGTWQTTALEPMAGNTVVQYFAQATDTAGTTVRQPASGTLSFTVFEPGLPVVASAINPASPRVGDAIFVTATITSQQGIDSETVLASFIASDGREGDIPMVLSTGNANSGTWTSAFAIEDLDEGDEFHYAVAARDTLGRDVRDPAAGYRSATVTAVPAEINIAGFKLTETDANIVLTFPANTIVPANGFVIVSRQATLAEFETLWGPLPDNALFINAHDIVGGNGMVINGGEVFTLTDASGTRIDGPTPSSLSASNARVFRTATDADTWERGLANDANPGELEIPGTGAGLIITEYCDPSTGFEEAFVEIYYDAPGAPTPSRPDMMVVY